LLRPDSIGSNGYRYYVRMQLLRLQQILLLRDLGLDLATIRAVVDAEHDPIEALRGHHRRPLEGRGRLDRLAETVAATIKHLEEGSDMPAENLYQGFRVQPRLHRSRTRTHQPARAARHQEHDGGLVRTDFQSFNDQWTPDKESYTALAESVSEPSEWRTHMDSLDPRLASYLRDAMLAYANDRM
jgi:DNA-binding transcriptional MerR regulator